MHIAVALSGLGGLLIELVLVRRYGLLLGNTSEASALVIGAYLLGLGAGGLLVPVLARRGGRLLGTAAALYACVALAALALDVFLRQLDPVPVGAGVALLVLTPGIPTLLMGAAFPLIFAGLGADASRFRVGLLTAANLAGSLVATAFGSNRWIPDLGVSTTLGMGVVAYAGAATILWLLSRRTDALSPRPADAARLPLRVEGWGEAALAGVLVVGLQVLLLRRLPFFLEGFQPTLSGVLAACLLGLTLGSAFGTPLLARLFAGRATLAALLGAVGFLTLGLHEHVIAPIAAWPVRTDLAMHARVWLAAGISAGPTCFLLGAVIPLLIARIGDPATRSAVAGRLFFWQGIGSVAGSILLTHALPPLWPAGYFVLAPLVLGLLGVLALVRTLRPLPAALAGAVVLGASLLGLSGAGNLLAPDPPMQLLESKNPGRYVFREHRTDSTVTASAVYDRAGHRMVLYTNEFRAAETGPFADYMHILGHLPFVLRETLDEVAVIAFGTGTTARSVALAPEPSQINLVEIASAVISLSKHFAGDGLLSEPRTPTFLLDPRTQVHVNDGRRFLARRPADSLDLVTMEPLLPYAPGTAYLYTREFYGLGAASLRPDGLLVQWIPTHALPPHHFRSLLASFARSFQHHSVWFVDGATLLVGSDTPHLPELSAVSRRLAAATGDERVSLHEARVRDAEDLLVTFVGDDLLAVVGDAPDVRDDRPFIEQLGVWKYDGSARLFYKANYALLEEVARAGREFQSDELRELRADRIRAFTRMQDASIQTAPMAPALEARTLLAAARQRFPGSIVLHYEETLALRQIAEFEVLRRKGMRIDGVLREQLDRDPASPLLQAARGLRGVAEDLRLPPEQAAARAAALRSDFFEVAPGFITRTVTEVPHASPLQDLQALPEGAALIVLASQPDATGVAVRSAYRVRVGYAFLDALAERPLTAREAAVFRTLLDPAFLRGAAAAIDARDGSPAELAALVRPDLALADRTAAARVPAGPR